jgi:hypothetical protein
MVSMPPDFWGLLEEVPVSREEIPCGLMSSAFLISRPTLRKMQAQNVNHESFDIAADCGACSTDMGV